MEFEDLLTKSKWSILKELAKGEKSAVEIAKKTNQSIANVTQQLQLLEAYNLVKKAKQVKEKKAGKPRTPYVLSQEIVLASMLKPGVADKKLLKLKELDECHRFLLNIFFILNPEDHYYLIKFACITDIIKKADTIAYLNSDDKEIEIMIITEHTCEVREKYSNMNITGLDGKTKKIISWTHNKKEIEEGLERKEDYFINLVKNSRELIDKKDNIKELRQANL
nr:winged helix-turn-helix transcriptional regulator [Nanoarchaeota archaeon]